MSAKGVKSNPYELGPEERALQAMLAKLEELRAMPVQHLEIRGDGQASSGGFQAEDQALLDALGASDLSFENVLYANHGGHFIFKKPLREVRLNLRRYHAQFDAIDFSVLVIAGKCDRSLWCTTRLEGINDAAYRAGLERLSSKLGRSHPRHARSEKSGDSGASAFHSEVSLTDASSSDVLELREIDFQSLLAADAGARDEYGMSLEQVMAALTQQGKRLDRIDYTVLAIAGDFDEGSRLEGRQELFRSRPFETALERLKGKPDLMESFLQLPEKDPRWKEGLLEAYEFAALAHKGKERKGTEKPYIVHPAGVAEILQRIGVRELTILRAALLHDVPGSTSVTVQDISERFGDEVSRLVSELTPPPRTQRDGGTFLQYLQLLPSPALMIALADRIDDVREMAINREEREKVRAYLHETRSFFLPLAERNHSQLARMLREACMDAAESQSFASTEEHENALRGTDGMPPLNPEKISEETIRLANYGSLACFDKLLRESVLDLEATTGEIFARWHFAGLVLAGRRERYKPVQYASGDVPETDSPIKKGTEPRPTAVNALSANEVLTLADLGSQAAFGLSLEGLRNKLELVRSPLEDEELIALAHLGINWRDSNAFVH